MSLPRIDTPADYDAIARDESVLRPAAIAIRAEAGLTGEITRFTDGSLPVYALGDSAVLKLYPPVYRHEGDLEQAVLRAVHGRLPIPTPGVLAAGERSGWGWVLMERLSGQSLAAVWPRLTARDRVRLCADLGEALAALHGVSLPADLVIPPENWADFVSAQTASAAERQRSRKLDPVWLEQIPDYLRAVDLTPKRTDVLLHTEIMREHLLVSETGSGGWKLSGLFDFEPAMRGDPEYDLASIGIFVTTADRDCLRALLTSYGMTLDAGLSRRVMAHALLHRFSHLRWYLERVPPPADVTTLDALAAYWWPP